MSDTTLIVRTKPLPPAFGTVDPDIWELTGAWLATKRSEHTREAYRRDLESWFAWCQETGRDPFNARVRDAEVWGAWLLDASNPERVSDATAARRMSAVASWYSYLVKHEALQMNPFADADRPKVDRYTSKTRWLSEDDARRLIEAADTGCGSARLRNAAVVRLMVELGIRVSEVVSLPVTALGWQGSHRVIRVLGKGHKTVERLLPAATAAAIDAYLAERAQREGQPPTEGPLFVTSTGKPLSRVEVTRLVQRLAARAGVKDPRQITSHSLRHTFATIARQRGATGDELQEAMAHVDRRTTDRYIRAAMRLERDPSQLVAAALG